jgi:tetratricopeptide (TPR) repeat protein
MPSYEELEKALEDAQQQGDSSAAADHATQMGLRLLAMATFARATASQGGAALAGMPAPDAALEPAIDLFKEALALIVSIEGDKDQAFVRGRLADCYLQSGQHENALEHFTYAYESSATPKIRFDAAQKIGDSHIELKQDEAALHWYSQAMEDAQVIDDPLEISGQLVKIAEALRNLKRYDEALEQYAKGRDLLVRIGQKEELQRKITVHKNTFQVSAIPKLVAYIEERIAHTREAIGRDLIRELPDILAEATTAVMAGADAPSALDWPVFRELDTAVRAATRVLGELLAENGEAPEVWESDDSSPLGLAGDLARHHYGNEMQDPENLAIAARLLMQVDRSRRGVIHFRKAAALGASPGPFGGGTSRNVVYLRSFIVGTRLPSFEVEPWGQVDLEEYLACKLDRSPLVALGDPDLDRFGPARVRTTDENWRRVLKPLAMEAQMLLVIPAATEGTSWEIEWVTTNKLLHKTCFVMPPGAAHEAWWTDNWEQVRQGAVRLGLKVPEYTPEGCVFRLTSEGLFDRMDFARIYESRDLHMTLLGQLLFRPNISYDFLFGLQQSMEDTRHDQEEAASEEGLSGQRATLAALEREPRFELSNWELDRPSTPDSPGILLYYETPFRLLYAEEVENLRDVLDRHARGEPSDFTRVMFHLKVVPLLTGTQTSQLLDSTLTIESVMSFRMKQLVSYRFLLSEDAIERAGLLDLVWSGASKCGSPKLPQPQ